MPAHILPRRAPIAALVLLVQTGCLIDIDIADNRRQEILAAGDTSDTGEPKDTADTGDTDDTGDTADTDIEPVDCSAIVAPPLAGDVRAIRNAGPHTCLLRQGGTGGLECTGPDDSSLLPLIPSGAYSAIDLGRGTFCGVKASDRSLVCVGAAEDLVNNVPDGTFAGVALTHDGEGDTACALHTTGQITCWGDNDFSLVTTAPAEGMCTVAMAQHHACGIRDNGTLACWGSGTEGVAGTAVPAGTFRDVTVGRDFACAVSSTGELECWGTDASWSDDEAMPDVDARWVAASNHAACALTDDDVVACWGPQPDDIPTDAFVQITGGNHKVCGLRSDESFECWGTPPTGGPP